MQNTLSLTEQIVPDTLPEAQDMCRKLNGEVSSYKDQITYIKQRYKMALMQLRPGLVTAEQLAVLFDEAEVTTDSEVDTQVEEESVNDAARSSKKKSRKKKRKAIPDHLPRTVVEHDLAADKKNCVKDNSPLAPIGYE